MFSGLNFLRHIGRFFKLEPIPHDKFDEWPVSAGQFLHEYHVMHVDRGKLTDCDPTCPWCNLKAAAFTCSVTSA